jgi:hypothetical protein
MKIGVLLLALLLAAMAMVPMVSAVEENSADSAIKNAEAAYQKENILASFGQIPKENNNFVDLKKINSNPWYLVLRKVNNETENDLEKYWYPNGPIIGQGTDMKGSIVIWINQNCDVDQSVITDIYSKISERGHQNGIENIPCRFILSELMKTESRTDKIRPVLGGIKVHAIGDYSTLGFVASDTQGNRGVVTTGHMGSVGSTLYQPDPAASNAIIGSINAIGNTYSDSAWTKFTNGATGVPKVYVSDTSYLTFKYYDDYPSTSTIYMSGVSSGTTTGTPLYTADVNSGYHNKVIKNQYLASYSSASGDSGAPIYEKWSTGENILVGIHMGRLGGNAVFSPVFGIRADLNVIPLIG